jgi:hypothetical protein
LINIFLRFQFTSGLVHNESKALLLIDGWKLAALIGSLDYLIADEDSQDFHYKDKELERYFAEADKLSEEDRQVIKKVIESLLKSKNIQQ